MADTLVKNPKLIVGTQSQVEAEMGANDIGFATDVEFYTSKQIDELLSKAGGASLPILMAMWSDHLLNDISWLRADTFSWQSGDVYKAAYEHLTGDLDTVQKLYCWIGEKMGDKYYTYSESPSVGETTTDGDAITRFDSYGRPVVGADYLDRYTDGDILSTQTDTIGDITITYYLAQDGHKICLPDQESNVSALYEATGVAWYYILDTDNKQFKLPRTKYGFTGLRDSVGGYVAPGLPNITGQLGLYGTEKNSCTASGAFTKNSGSMEYGGDHSKGAGLIADFNASNSNAIYGASDTVQQPATQMYLYFYVGNFEQDSVEQTAGLNAELFNGKADRNLLNTTDNVDIVVESQLPTADNGYTWYRKYKSGWVEQGGRADVTTGRNNITMPIVMSDVNYTALLTRNSGSSATSQVDMWRMTVNDTTTTFCVYAANNTGAIWTVSGMSA